MNIRGGEPRTLNVIEGQLQRNTLNHRITVSRRIDYMDHTSVKLPHYSVCSSLPSIGMDHNHSLTVVDRGCTLKFAYSFPNVVDDCSHNFLIDGTQGLVQTEIQYGGLIDGFTEHSNHQRSEGDYIQRTASLQY